MARWSVLAVACLFVACQAAVLPATQSPPPTPDPAPTHLPRLSRVTLEPAAARTARISPDGGTLEATDDRGTVYRLDLPAAALVRDTEIALVPFSSISDLPGEAALAAGVHLLPEGLVLWQAAALTITLAEAPANATLAFAYGADFESPFRYPAQVDGGTVRFDIVHFSGYGNLMATDAAMDAAALGLTLAWPPAFYNSDQALASIAAVIDSQPGTARDESINAAVEQWLRIELEPLRTSFATLTTWDFDGPFGSAALAAERELATWFYLERLFALSCVTLDAALAQRGRAVATSIAVHAVAVLNGDCHLTSAASAAEFRMPELFGWQAFAERNGLAAQNPQLGRDFLIEHACVQVEYDMTDGTEFPEGIGPGDSGTLQIHARLAVQGLEPAEYATRVTVLPHGTDPEAVVMGETGVDGRFSRSFVWDTEAAELRLDVEVCIRNVPVCAQAFVVRGGGGERILLSGSPGGRGFAIYMVEPDGTDLTAILASELAGQPVWSADRSKIAFTRTVADEGPEIFVMNADGSVAMRVTNEPGNAGRARWSPDGSKILYAATRDTPVYRRDLFVIFPDGTGRTELTQDGVSEDADWSPDGARIVFARASEEETRRDIYVMNADGSGEVRLTNDGSYNLRPAWSPDGSAIAFASTRDGGMAIFLMAADGSGVTRLTDATAFDHDPVWSPNGRRIAFLRGSGPDAALYVMTTSGTDITKLVDAQISWIDW